MRGPRLPAPWLLLPLDGALHYPEIQTGQRGQSLGGQVCDLLAQGSVFTAMLPLLSLPAGGLSPPCAQGRSEWGVCPNHSHAAPVQTCLCSHLAVWPITPPHWMAGEDRTMCGRGSPGWMGMGLFLSGGQAGAGVPDEELEAGGHG